MTELQASRVCRPRAWRPQGPFVAAIGGSFAEDVRKSRGSEIKSPRQQKDTKPAVTILPEVFGRTVRRKCLAEETAEEGWFVLRAVLGVLPNTHFNVFSKSVYHNVNVGTE